LVLLKTPNKPFSSGSREKAEASFGLERIRWQTWFHDLPAQAAYTNDKSGTL